MKKVRSQRALRSSSATVVNEYQKLVTASVESKRIMVAIDTAAVAVATGAGTTTPSAPPTTAPTAAPPPAAPIVQQPIQSLYHLTPNTASGPPETSFTPLFTTLDLKYHEWNGYRRGRGLYGELSNSIHGYNKQYEVNETNWARSDYLILQWLKPNMEENSPVEWMDERVKKNLPFTP
jgi:hypothetical protein